MRVVASLLIAAAFSLFVPVQVRGQQPVPSQKMRRAGQRSISQVFGADLKSARTPFLKQSLGKRLLKTADETSDDEGARYELYLTARNLAVEAGDLELAVESLTKCAQVFQVDLLATEGAAALKTGTKIKEPRQLDHMLGIANRATDAENFKLAMKVFDLAVKTARRLDDDDRFSLLVEQRSDMENRRKAWAASERAEEDLKRNPNDRTASRIRGEYLCFYREQWADGLTLLSRTGDKQLTKIIRNEFQAPTTTEGKLALADAWWDWINKDSAKRSDYLGVAKYRYEKVKPELSGINLRRVEDRLLGLADVRFVRTDSGSLRKPEARAMTVAELGRWALRTGGGCYGYTKDRKFGRLPDPVPDGFELRRVKVGSQYVFTDADCVRLSGHNTVSQLYIHSSKIRGDGLAMVSPALTGLRIMNKDGARGVNMSEAGLATILKRFPRLADIAIDECAELPPASLANLMSRPWQHLRLGYPSKVQTNHIELLSDSPELQHLAIHHADLSNVNLASLQKCKTLKSLHLTDVSLPPSAIGTLSKMTQLNTLLLRGTQIGDREVGMLRGLTNLESLGLEDTLISDVSVPVLVQFRKLKYLHLTRTRISRQGLAQLRKQLPKCRIFVP